MEDISGRVIKIRNVEQFPFLPLSRDGRYFSMISFVETKQRISVIAKGENYSSSRTKYHLLSFTLISRFVSTHELIEMRVNYLSANEEVFLLISTRCDGILFQANFMARNNSSPLI